MATNVLRPDSNQLFHWDDAAALEFPLAKSCNACATAKIKCRRAEDSPICDRCRRLHRDCLYRPALRRDHGTKRDHRMDELESRIKELLEVQRSSNNARSVSPNQRQPNVPSPLSSGNRSYAPTSNSHSTPGALGGSPPQIQYKDVVDDGLVTMEAAAVFFENFKRFMAPNFPFVVIPPATTVDQLRKEKPFLFLAVISTAACQDVRLQRRLGTAVKHYVAVRMILEGDTSFDLLQGLLVHLAWGQYQSRPRRHNQFLQLAISIVVELRLERPRKNEDWKTPVSIKPGSEASTQKPQTRDSDSKRAVAGCYYLSSSVATTLQKMPTFPYSVYVENYCKTLAENMEYPSDKFLLPIIQLQQIHEKIDRLSIQHAPSPQNPDLNAELYVTAMKSELEMFKERLPFRMGECQPLVFQYHAIELYLYQICLRARPIDTSQAPAKIPAWSSWRIETLCAGLISAKSLLDFYTSLPVSIEYHFNNSQLVHLGLSIMISTKLAAAARDDTISLTTKTLRDSLNMDNILEQFVIRVEYMARKGTDDTGDTDIFTHYLKRVQFLQHWYRSHASDDYQSIHGTVLPQIEDGQAVTSGPESHQDHAQEGTGTGTTTMYLPPEFTAGDLEEFDQWGRYAYIDNMMMDFPWSFELSGHQMDQNTGRFA